MNAISQSLFHPAVAAWFAGRFAAPTPAQAAAWPAIQAGRDTLIAAPTGSGKTLAAFLAAIDALLRQGLEGPLPDATQIVYVSPLKALSNDMQRNLEAPLAGISESLRKRGLCRRRRSAPGCAPATRPPASASGCAGARRTSSSPRPESLYILLGSRVRARDARERRAASSSTRSTRSRANKRGAHLALSLERLRRALPSGTLLRIGLSATQKPIEEVARFLVGARDREPHCAIVDTGHHRAARSRPRGAALAARGGDVGAMSGSRSMTASPS